MWALFLCLSESPGTIKGGSMGAPVLKTASLLALRSFWYTRPPFTVVHSASKPENTFPVIDAAKTLDLLHRSDSGKLNFCHSAQVGEEWFLGRPSATTKKCATLKSWTSSHTLPFQSWYHLTRHKSLAKGMSNVRWLDIKFFDVAVERWRCKYGETRLLGIWLISRFPFSQKRLSWIFHDHN